MVPRPSSRFPRMLRHAHEFPLRMINHLFRSPTVEGWRQSRPSSIDAKLGGNSIEVVRAYTVQMAYTSGRENAPAAICRKLPMPALIAGENR